MKIFISWSGERSNQVALLLRSWLKCVLQASTPWVSEVDIDRGAAWFSEITKVLEDCINGIICITKGNLTKPWLLFEAGALAKGINSSRVCTFLIDLDPKDIGEPLSQFNHTLPNKEGMLKLVKTLNSRMMDLALPSDILEMVFHTYWPQFDDGFKNILAQTTEDKLPERKESDVIYDVLSTMRRMEKRLSLMEKHSALQVNQELCDYKRRIDSNKFTKDYLDEVLAEAYLLGASDEDAIKMIISKCGLTPKEARDNFIDYVLKLRDQENVVTGQARY